MAKPRQHARRGLTLLFSGMVAAGVLAARLRADVSVEDLTSAAISGVGPYYQDVEDAIRKFAAKDYAGAMERLEKAKRTVPRLAPAEVMMAQLYADANQPQQTVGMLERAVTRYPQDPEPYVALGERAAAEGRYTEAYLLFDKADQVLAAFTENPKRKQALQVRLSTGAAAADEARGDNKAARARLEALIKLDPKNAMAHEKLGRVLFALQDLRAAYAELKAAAEADPSMMTPELAMSALYANDKVNSEKWLKAALAKGASDLRTQLGAARAFLKNNQLDEAKTHAEAAIKLDPEGPEANLLMGLVARAVGDLKTAEFHLSKAHLLAPANPAITNQLALVLAELPGEQNLQRAYQFAEVNLRQKPNVPEVVATMGWVNYRLNRRSEAERAFNAVVNANSGNRSVSADMLYYLAHLARDKGRSEEAAKLLKDALSINEPFAYRKQAQTMLDQIGKGEKAEKTTAAKTDGPSAGAKPKDAK